MENYQIELKEKGYTLIESFLQTRIPIKTTIDINTDKKAFLKKLKDFKQFMQKVHLPNELYNKFQQLRAS